MEEDTGNEPGSKTTPSLLENGFQHSCHAWKAIPVARSSLGGPLEDNGVERNEFLSPLQCRETPPNRAQNCGVSRDTKHQKSIPRNETPTRVGVLLSEAVIGRWSDELIDGPAAHFQHPATTLCVWWASLVGLFKGLGELRDRFPRKPLRPLTHFV